MPCLAIDRKFERNRQTMIISYKRWLLLAGLALAGFVLGRLSIRAGVNALVGGTLFGGNFL